jgi:probable HAF family extracellular repeat protein
MQDLGVLPSCFQSGASGINANGQVVGACGFLFKSSLHNRAFLYESGAMHDLGTLGSDESWALAINDHGDVVGDSYTASLARHAFLYRSGMMTDLNDLIPVNSGWILTEAAAINDSGQIAGTGISPSGQTHAFLLTPNNSPEPASFAMAVLGALTVVAFGFWRRTSKC